MTQIDPRDPNAALWEYLTRGMGKGKVKPKTAEIRKKLSDSCKAYYAENLHHNIDPDVVSNLEPQRSRDGVSLATCRVCNQPIYDEHFAEIGIGKTCLKEGIAAGRIVVNPDGKYRIRRRWNPKKGK